MDEWKRITTACVVALTVLGTVRVLADDKRPTVPAVHVESSGSSLVTDATPEKDESATVGWFLAVPDVTDLADHPNNSAESLDFDDWVSRSTPSLVSYESDYLPPGQAGSSEPWSWQLLPGSLIYKSYLAGTKESRLSAVISHERDTAGLLDGTLGGRFGVLRYGTTDPIWPEGFQMDVEASAQVRLDMPEERDVRSTDYRAGVPFSYGRGRHRTKFGYYHLSSHLGDEYLLKHNGYPRLNYSRDVLVLGHAYYLRPEIAIYGEAAWAFYSDISREWEFQFGLDYAPAAPTGLRGAPFFAINGHLREELNFGGGLTVQTGWSWRSAANGQLLRAGFHYYNGGSNQFSFYRYHEELIGGGLWYDY